MNSLSSKSTTFKGLIAWMAEHKVAANLLMLFFILGGIASFKSVKQEVFPEIFTDTITISVSYPGSSPQEIERGVLQSVESAVQGVDGVKKITSVARENSGVITAEIEEFVNQDKVLQDIKNEVDRIQTFPADIEKPTFSLDSRKRLVLSIIIYGNQKVATLNSYAKSIKNQLIQEPGITFAEILDPPAEEIQVHISQNDLQKQGLRLDEIANKISNNSRELSAGSLRTPSGEILVRVDERKDIAKDLGSIPLSTGNQGQVLQLKDIASISEGFAEDDREVYFQGMPAVRIGIYSVGKESPIEVANAGKELVKRIKQDISGKDLNIDVFLDDSQKFKERIQLLQKNVLLGLALILLILGVFVNPRLAFWVMIGMLISVVGSLTVFNHLNATINMVSLFAYIVTLGIVVDDAIIVGEAIHEKTEQGMPHMQAAIEGAKEMLAPVVFAVLTNIIAFLPLLLVPGEMGDIFRHIPAVVIAVLAISLIEALFILPRHLSHEPAKFWAKLSGPQVRFNKWLDRRIESHYVPFVHKCLNWRYLTALLAILILLGGVSLVKNRIIKFTFLPVIDTGRISVTANLPYGTPINETREAMQQLIASAYETEAFLIKEQGRDPKENLILRVYTKINGSHNLTLSVKLHSADDINMGSQEFADTWQKRAPKISSLERLSFKGSTGFGRGKSIDLEITHKDPEIQEAAAREIAAVIENMPGTFGIDDGIELGKEEFKLQLKPQAYALGFNITDLARQVRAAYYGVEAKRFQRGEEEVKIMVSLPPDERNQILNLEALRIKSPVTNGNSSGYIPLGQLVDIEKSRSYTRINRTNQNRIINITGNVNATLANANETLLELKNVHLPKIAEKYSGLDYSFEGESETQKESLGFLGFTYIFIMLAIWGLLALVFRSYSQPIAVMLGVPYGIIGAIIGHLIFGVDLSIISFIGLIGLSGIVINDALVLITTINKHADSGMSIFEACLKGSGRRLRPILLTTVTTSCGLLPMMLETSVQAKFLIPMAISIGFGIIFATLVTLVLVPCNYLIIEDIKRFFTRKGANEGS